jgi:phosphodiester glycosidase
METERKVAHPDSAVTARRLTMASRLRRVSREVNLVATASALGLALASLPAPASAQHATPEVLNVRDVVPGVTLQRIVDPAGPWILHVLTVDLRRPELYVRAVRACDRLSGRERPSAIARRLRGEGLDVVGVLNADFFDLKGGTGANENNLVVDGEIAKAVAVTESPFDTFDNVHSQLGLSASGAPVLDRFALAGTVRTPYGTWPLAGVNAASLSTSGGLDLLTRWSDWAARVPRSTAATVAEATLELLEQNGDTSRYRVRPRAAREGGRKIAVLTGAGQGSSAVKRLRPGDEVIVVIAFAPNPGLPLRTLVGGWPRIVRAGRSVAAEADSVEGTFPRFSKGRHPRSAVGFSRDSLTLYFVAVDGRTTASVGMSLAELADAMIALGAYEALNLDGGGSTTLVVGDSIVNAPSDATGERPVGNVLAITHRGSDRQMRDVPARTGTVATCVLSGAADPDIRRR